MEDCGTPQTKFSLKSTLKKVTTTNQIAPFYVKKVTTPSNSAHTHDDCYDKQVTKLQSQQTMGKAGPKKGANGALNRKNTQARSNNNKLRVFSRKM